MGHQYDMCTEGNWTFIDVRARPQEKESKGKYAKMMCFFRFLIRECWIVSCGEAEQGFIHEYYRPTELFREFRIGGCFRKDYKSLHVPEMKVELEEQENKEEAGLTMACGDVHSSVAYSSIMTGWDRWWGKAELLKLKYCVMEQDQAQAHPNFLYISQLLKLLM